MRKVAALYVDPKGVYAGLEDVEVWDEARDARLYEGPWPVVAHPPCNRWSNMAYVAEAKHGHRVGDDGGTFRAALGAVKRWGGVLEHPGPSAAFAAYGLPKPPRHAWERVMWHTSAGYPMWVTEVSQVAYGHRARKRTWLVYAGVNPPPLLDWSEPEAEMRCDWMSGTGSERSATPKPFRDLLLAMARSAR